MKEAQSIAAIQGLTFLDLSENSIGNERTQQLKKAQGLTSLHLRENSIGETGAQHLLNLQALTSLKLGGPSFKTKQMRDTVARHIANLVGLTSLDLSHHEITPELAFHQLVVAHTGRTMSEPSTFPFCPVKDTIHTNMSFFTHKKTTLTSKVQKNHDPKNRAQSFG
jgi:hypothetical protein